MPYKYVIKEDRMIALVTEGIKTMAYAGMIGMHQGPAAVKRLKVKGVALAERQEVRHLLVTDNGDEFLLCLLDGAKGEMYWAFWRVYKKYICGSSLSFTTYKWAGYCNDTVARPA